MDRESDMSWGERSCLACTAPVNYCDMGSCNVNCPYYKWDGKTKPDSIPDKGYSAMLRESESNRLKEKSSKENTCCGMKMELKLRKGKYYFSCFQCGCRHKAY